MSCYPPTRRHRYQATVLDYRGNHLLAMLLHLDCLPAIVVSVRPLRDSQGMRLHRLKRSN